jgi:hypothetical protein
MADLDMGANKDVSKMQRGQEIFDGFTQKARLDYIVATPVLSLVGAQKAANADYLDYINRVMLDEQGNVKHLTFKYNFANGVEDPKAKSVTVPLLGVLTHPCIGIETAEVEYTVSVNEVNEDTIGGEGSSSVNMTSANSVTGLTIGAKGALSATESRTRKTDTTAKFTFKTTMSRIPPSEAMNKLLDALMA